MTNAVGGDRLCAQPGCEQGPLCLAQSGSSFGWPWRRSQAGSLAAREAGGHPARPPLQSGEPFWPPNVHLILTTPCPDLRAGLPPPTDSEALKRPLSSGPRTLAPRGARACATRTSQLRLRFCGPEPPRLPLSCVAPPGSVFPSQLRLSKACPPSLSSFSPPTSSPAHCSRLALSRRAPLTKVTFPAAALGTRGRGSGPHHTYVAWRPHRAHTPGPPASGT